MEYKKKYPGLYERMNKDKDKDGKQTNKNK